MKPRRIILVRHGQSEGNVDKHVYGQKPDYALNLTLKGRMQAFMAGKKLYNLGGSTAFYYVSPLFRTKQTFEQLLAGLINERRSKTTEHLEFPPFLEEPRLREQEWGHLKTSMECDSIDHERDAYGTFYYRIPDGESAADVYDRVSDFIGAMHRDFEKISYPNTAVLVTHGMAIRLFLMRWLHWTVEEFETYKNPDNCAIVVMELNEATGKYQLKTELERSPAKHPHQFKPSVIHTGQGIVLESPFKKAEP